MGFHAHPCFYSIHHSGGKVKYFFQISCKRKISRYAQTDVLLCEIRVHSDFSEKETILPSSGNICLICWHFCADALFSASEKIFSGSGCFSPFFSCGGQSAPQQTFPCLPAIAPQKCEWQQRAESSCLRAFSGIQDSAPDALREAPPINGQIASGRCRNTVFCAQSEKSGLSGAVSLPPEQIILCPYLPIRGKM